MSISANSPSEACTGERCEVSIQPTMQDFMDYYRAIYRSVYRLNLPYLIAIWVLVVVIGSALLKAIDEIKPALSRDEPSQLIVAVIIYVVVFYGIMKFFWKYIISSRIDERGHFLTPKTVSITPEGYREESANLSSFMKWAGILRIDETKKCILLYVDKVSAYVIPKQALGDEKQKQDFLALARKYHREAQNPTSSSCSSIENHASPAA